MKKLRSIRIFLSVLMIAASIGYAFFSEPAHPFTTIIPYTQIVPSMFAVAIGSIAFWIIVTLFFGRIYCAAFCPIGIIQDMTIGIKRILKKRPTRQRYRPRKNIRYHILVVYILCLITGFMVIPYLLEPWNMFLNISSTINSQAVSETWLRLGTGIFTGLIAGMTSLTLIIICAWFFGRDFCNYICPIGTILGFPGQNNMMHIEIDPDKCISCLKCEEICRSGCIKVANRYIDNSRCVRCFDCTYICPNDAIKYQLNRNRPTTPMVKRVGQTEQ